MKAIDDRILSIYDKLDWTFQVKDIIKLTGMKHTEVSYQLTVMESMKMVYIPEKSARTWHKCYQTVISWLRSYLKRVCKELKVK